MAKRCGKNKRRNPLPGHGVLALAGYANLDGGGELVDHDDRELQDGFECADENVHEVVEDLGHDVPFREVELNNLQSKKTLRKAKVFR